MGVVPCTRGRLVAALPRRSPRPARRRDPRICPAPPVARRPSPAPTSTAHHHFAFRFRSARLASPSLTFQPSLHPPALTRQCCPAPRACARSSRTPHRSPLSPQATRARSTFVSHYRLALHPASRPLSTSTVRAPSPRASGLARAACKPRPRRAPHASAPRPSHSPIANTQQERTPERYSKKLETAHPSAVYKYGDNP